MENIAVLQMFIYQQFYFIFLITSLRYVHIFCVGLRQKFLVLQN